MSNIRGRIMSIIWRTMEYFAATYDSYEGDVQPCMMY